MTDAKKKVIVIVMAIMVVVGIIVSFFLSSLWNVGNVHCLLARLHSQHINAVNLDVALITLEQTEHALEESTLAGTIVSEYAQQLAWMGIESDSFQNLVVAVCELQIFNTYHTDSPPFVIR